MVWTFSGRLVGNLQSMMVVLYVHNLQANSILELLLIIVFISFEHFSRGKYVNTTTNFAAEYTMTNERRNTIFIDTNYKINAFIIDTTFFDYFG